MKKLLFLLVLVRSISYAQTEIGTAFQTEMNTLFQNVSRTPITTGLLKEYGMRFTDVGKLNGVLTTSNYCSRGVWSSLYTSLYFMKFNNNVSLTNPEVVNASIDNYNITDGAVINLMALHYQYEQFKTNAATSNLVYLSNNQIFDTPNRPTTPYEVKDAVGFTAARQTADGGNQTFVLRSDLFLKNVTKTITALQIDFGNGAGFQNVTLGTNVNVTYPSSGEKALILKITYSDGQVVQSQTKLWLTNVIPPFARFSSPVIEFFPKNTSFPVPTSQMGTGIVSVATAGTDGILDKPLILVEGFDPENRFGYQDYLIKENTTNRVNFK
ncbi:MAG: hypothetical protein ORN54_05890 [Cyclobacteriaceae bacterium]|nr:hypothetical protein [Cyclobacteriaceae bacterium]